MANKVMKAVVFKRHGNAKVLEVASVPRPTPGLGEALIRVKACAINHLDIWARQGMPGIEIPRPHILGSDVAGIIESLGSPVSGFKKGQPVVVAPGLSCGACPQCRAGQDSRCAQFQILGLQINGGYAQYVKVPIRNLTPISTKDLSFQQWAAAPLVFLTAWHMLMTRGKLSPGETVLIHAAGSGIGSAALQIARWRKARVLTTVGSKSKVKQAKKLGADQVLLYKEKNFAKEALRLTQDQGVDLVFEHIGPETWADSMRCLARGGRMVTCGATSGGEVQIDLRYFFVKELSVTGCYMGSRQEQAQVFQLIQNGVLHPVVDTTFPLKDAAKAHLRMESRKNFGKLVLVP